MFTYPVTVEFEDVDSYSIAHHTKLIAYLERARVHFFAERGIDLNAIDFGLVLRSINVQFKMPLMMLDTVTIEVRTKNIQKLRFEWDYRIMKDDKPAVLATIEQVFIDITTKKIIPIPEHAKSLLESIKIKE